MKADRNESPPTRLQSIIPDTDWQHTVERKRTTSSDGTSVYYETVGVGAQTILLANGLGGRLYAWRPLVDAYWTHYRFITWDYRGLFESEMPRSHRRLAIGNHVEDATAILEAESCARAAIIGWSMGVQVGLDVAASHPELVSALVLLNGTYGHALSTGLQPLISIPWLPKRLHFLIELVRRHPIALQAIAAGARATEVPSMLLFTATAGRRALTMRPLIRQYMEDVLGESFDSYMRLFQELDAHSVYHLLPEIETNALVISGALDPLTPAYQSREIARRMPNAQYIPLRRASHFCLMERPDIVVPAIQKFLTEKARW